MFNEKSKMSQWQELLSLNSAHQTQVFQVYNDYNFPCDIRCVLSDWIEGQNWDSAACDEGQARTLFHELLQQLEDRYHRLAQANNLLDGPNYVLLRIHVKTLFEASPAHMAQIVSRCLAVERRIITAAKAGQDCTAINTVTDDQIPLDDSIRELKRNIQDADCKIKSIDQQLRNYDISLKAWQDEVKQLNGSPVSQELQMTKINIDTSLFDLFRARLDLGYLMGSSGVLAEQVVSTLVEEELSHWRLRQQLACVGAPQDSSLHKLQTWFTLAADALNVLLQQLRKLQELDQQSPPNDNVSSLRTQCEETTQRLFTKLLKNALVVESQPCTVSSAHRPLIIKTGGVRFALKTRFLVNVRSLYRCMSKVTLVFDKDFDEIGAVNRFRKFSFTNKESKLLDTEESGLVAHFEGLSLKEVKVKDNRQNESSLAVTEELHFITCEMKLELTDSTVDIETSTLPLVVISSTNQGSMAWASILWSAMVPDHQPKNLLFLAPPPVTWQQLSEVLGWQFLAMRPGTASPGLDDQQLAMLRDKFEDHDGLVHWNKFYKCNGPWLWIDGILDLIKKHLLPIWCKGHIMGFVSRESAIALLDDKPSGTFLLRFSESIKEGAITISWVDQSKPKGFQVAAVEPFTKKELEARSLADYIRTYHVKCPGRHNVYPLLYLYPDIPMDHAFQQYYSTPVEIKGYVRRFPEHASVDNTPPPSPEDDDVSPRMQSLADMDMDYQPSPVPEVYPDLHGL